MLPSQTKVDLATTASKKWFHAAGYSPFSYLGPYYMINCREKASNFPFQSIANYRPENWSLIFMIGTIYKQRHQMLILKMKMRFSDWRIAIFLYVSISLYNELSSTK